MIKYIAKFKGKNQSLGYIPGEEYVIIITDSTIQQPDGSGVCKYATLETFFKNWQIVAAL